MAISNRFTSANILSGQVVGYIGCLPFECSRPREDTMTHWIQLVRAEYHEMPGLHLTKPQVQRLWNLDTTMCDAVLQALEAAQFLRRTNTGAYVKV